MTLYQEQMLRMVLGNQSVMLSALALITKGNPPLEVSESLQDMAERTQGFLDITVKPGWMG